MSQGVKLALSLALSAVALAMILIAGDSLSRDMIVVGAFVVAGVVGSAAIRIAGIAGPLVGGIGSGLLVGATVAIVDESFAGAALAAAIAAAIVGTGIHVLRELRTRPQR